MSPYIGKLIRTSNTTDLHGWSVAHRQCQHMNGWYATIKFWVFKRYIYLCSDCGDVQYIKESEK